MSLLLRLLPQSGRTQPGSNLYKSTKWTDPTKGQHHSLQSGRTQPGSNSYSSQSGWTQPGSNSYNSKKWTDPTRVKLIQVRKVDGSHQGSTPLFTKWMDQTRVKLISPQSGTDPTKGQHHNPHNRRTQPVHKIIQVHKVDGHQGSRPHSTEWTDPTRVANFIKVHNVDGSN